jgi:hypothetical protein
MRPQQCNHVWASDEHTSNILYCMLDDGHAGNHRGGYQDGPEWASEDVHEQWALPLKVKYDAQRGHEMRDFKPYILGE